MLTKKQKQIFDYIERYIKKNKYSPTLEEIKGHFGLSSVATVHQHIETLREKGFLKKKGNQPRSIELNNKKEAAGLVAIPLLGFIAAGAPIDVVENKETIKVPQTQLAKSGEHFALRVQGDSMIDEGIFDGDTVIVRKQNTVENGETAVALINGNEATLKKIYKENGGFRLQPANPAMQPIFTKKLEVQGKVVSVMRNFETTKEKDILPETEFIYPAIIATDKERKVKNRGLKEKLRGGTKYFNESLYAPEPKNLEKFVNKIICGDSEEIIREMPANSVDIIVTSPPYNFGLNYKEDSKDDAMKWEEYFKKLSAVWAECARVLKPGGRFCVNVQPLFSDYIPTHHIISKQLLGLGLLWKGEILWDKHNYNCKYTAWGSWKSPSMPYLKYTWEFIEVFCKASHKKTGDAQNIDITGDEFKKWVYAKWDIAPERNMKKYEHPAMFPEEIVARLLKLFSYKKDVVLDPFNGAGTTTAVAKRSGRRFIGIDIAQDYCKSAERRLKETLF